MTFFFFSIQKPSQSEIPRVVDSNDEEIEESAESHGDGDSSSEAGSDAELPRAAKREKVDSGVDADLEGVEPNPDSPFVYMDSDDSTCSYPEGND